MSNTRTNINDMMNNLKKCEPKSDIYLLNRRSPYGFIDISFDSGEIKEIKEWLKTSDFQDLLDFNETKHIAQHLRLPEWLRLRDPTGLKTRLAPEETMLDSLTAGDLYILGMTYSNGWGVEINATKSFTYFKMAAEMGHTNALSILGSLLLKHDDKDIKKIGRTYIKEAAAKNDALALTVVYDLENDIDSLLKASALGFTEAMWILGEHYYYGKDINKKETGLAYLFDAINLGYPGKINEQTSVELNNVMDLYGGLEKHKNNLTSSAYDSLSKNQKQLIAITDKNLSRFLLDDLTFLVLSYIAPNLPEGCTYASIRKDEINAKKSIEEKMIYLRTMDGTDESSDTTTTPKNNGWISIGLSYVQNSLFGSDQKKFSRKDMALVELKKADNQIQSYEEAERAIFSSPKK